MIPQSRVRYFRKSPNGALVDTGWEEVQYNGTSTMWEPVDTVFARGLNGPTKKITDIRIVDEPFLTGGASLVGGNVGNLRTGTVGE